MPVMPTRIFIVDDHRIMREAVRRILSDHAHLEVVGDAGDSETAWRGITELRPDLVLMDLEMPGEGGMTLTRRIHAAFPNIKVVVLTSHIDPRLASDALAAGARGYLFKINGSKELLTAVQTVLAGEVYICAESSGAMVRAYQLGRRERSAEPKPALSAREQDVLRLIVQGLRNKEIAAQLKVGIKSVETFRSRFMKKLGCSTPADLVRCALRDGLATT